jgi:hypothetical protein
VSAQQPTQEQREEAQRQRIAEADLTQPTPEDKSSNTAEILRYLSEIDDLPIETDDPIMGQLVSKVTSTANLTPEEVRSNEWVREYLLVLYLCKHPTKEGCHSSDRAWAHDDIDAYVKPMDADRRMQIETFVTSSKLALSGSEDMSKVKESVRTVKESIVTNDSDSSSSGGLLGRLGLR